MLFILQFKCNRFIIFNLQGKDDGYDRTLLDFFFSYHQLIHLVCRVAINCEKFTETLVKLSKYDRWAVNAAGFLKPLAIQEGEIHDNPFIIFSFLKWMFKNIN